MTEKLFWTNPYQTEFSAAVVDQFPSEQGHAVVLDRTCFYATSGGQPHDTGLLNSLPVRDVRTEDDRILHIVPSRVDATNVNGVIDWTRRYDHMQQHSGQHMLSAAFYQLFQAETSSFHLGVEECSIELNNPNLKDSQVREAEQLANEVILSAKEVKSFLIDPEKAKDYPLRKKSDLTEALRIVQFGDFDMSPCSGTHVRNTAEVGAIFIYGFEKLSQTVKVTFLCGNRVRTRYHTDLAVLKSLSKTLTTSFDLLPASVNKLLSQIKELRKENMQMKEGKLKAEAMQLLVKAEDWYGKHLMIACWKRPYDEVRYLAQRLSEQGDIVGAFASVEDDRIVFFKNKNLNFDLRAVFQDFLMASGAKGGGAPHFMEAGNFAVATGLEQLLNQLFARRA